MRSVVVSSFSRTCCLVLAALCQFIAPLTDLAAETFRWTPNRVDAHVQELPLEQLLAKIADATGWQVYVEQGSDRLVTVKFKELSQAEALRRLLGDLNFAVVRQPDQPTRLLVYRTSIHEAVQLVPKPPAASKIIRDELIVTLKPGGDSIEDIAKAIQAKVIGSVDALNAYRLKFKDEATANAAGEWLEEHPQAEVDPNFRVDVPTNPEPVASGPPAFALKPKVNTQSGTVIVAVVDTAVQPVDPAMNGFVLPPLQIAGDPGTLPSDPTHGTSMLATVLHGLAAASSEPGGSSVRVLPVDVYGPNPETTTFDVARGIHAAINAGATVINLSMGGANESPFLANLIHQAHQQGVLFFGAAGNEPTAAPTFPAAYSEVVAVTAADRRGQLAPYANRGSFVDVIAPGASIVQHNGQSYLINGTSTATAFVSGTAAAFRASGRNPAETELLIRQSGGEFHQAVRALNP